MPEHSKDRFVLKSYFTRIPLDLLQLLFSVYEKAVCVSVSPKCDGLQILCILEVQNGRRLSEEAKNEQELRSHM